jgi:hypothetical protein
LKSYIPDKRFNPEEFNKNLADFSPNKEFMLYEIDDFKAR